jgi:hypothetical protein
MLIIEACQLTPVVLLLLRNLQTEGDTEMKLKLCIQPCKFCIQPHKTSKAGYKS